MPCRAVMAIAALLATCGNSLAVIQVTSTNPINIRAGPRPFYPLASTAAPGASLTLLGCIQNSTWCSVEFRGKWGWVDGDYITSAHDGIVVPVNEYRTLLEVPLVTYDEEDKEQFAGASIAGAVIPGPAGAVIVDSAPRISDSAVTFLRSVQGDPVYLEGEAVVGASLPESVKLRMIPEYQYAFARVNGQNVVVDPLTRMIVYVDYDPPPIRP